MASITVRSIDDSLKTRLRVRAAHHGRSMEEETRQILRHPLASNRTGRIWPTWRRACSARTVQSSSRILGSRRASRPISDLIVMSRVLRPRTSSAGDRPHPARRYRGLARVRLRADFPEQGLKRGERGTSRRRSSLPSRVREPGRRQHARARRPHARPARPGRGVTMGSHPSHNRV